MTNIHPIPAFNDNYIWAISDGVHCVVVDPGQAAPVEAYLTQNGLQLDAILVTHHHPDHIGGIPALLEQHGDLTVYGPANESIATVTHPLVEADQIDLPCLALSLNVIEVPGHTLGHIVYFSDNKDSPLLFAGDTLFRGGCGRVFEGTPAQMLHSLDKLSRLPASTQVFCAHEYTLANLAFACAVTPNDKRLADEVSWCEQQRDKALPTLPSTIAIEKQINPFLRVDNASVIQGVKSRMEGEGRVATFAALRAWKNNFRG